MPGTNFQPTMLPGLNPNINRFMIYQQGCYAGRTCLCLAKDLVENNVDAQDLVVCAEITTMFFLMKHGCVSGFRCGSRTWQFLKKSDVGAAIKKLLKIFLFIFSIYY